MFLEHVPVLESIDRTSYTLTFYIDVNILAKVASIVLAV